MLYGYEAMALLFILKGQHTQAFEFLKKTPRDNYDILLLKAYSCCRIGRNSDSLKLLKKAFDLMTERGFADSFLFYIQGMTLLQMGYSIEGQKRISMARSMDPPGLLLLSQRNSRDFQDRLENEISEIEKKIKGHSRSSRLG